MICLLAGSRLEALRWSYGQQLDQKEWFCPDTYDEIHDKKDFHVITLPGFAELPERFRDKMYQLARHNGSRR